MHPKGVSHERVDLPAEWDVKEGEQVEPHVRIDEEENEDLRDQTVLVRLHSPVVLEVVERPRELHAVGSSTGR